MTVRWRGILVLAIAVLSGCAPMPDMQLAKQQLQSGDQKDAETNLAQLAAFGMVDAQVKLGDLYASENTPESTRKAMRWYQAAAGQGSTRAKVRIGKIYAAEDDAPQAWQLADKAFHSALASGDESALMPLVDLYLDHPQVFPPQKVKPLIDRAMDQGIPEARYAKARYELLSGEFSAHRAEIEKLCTPVVTQVPDCYGLLGRAYLETHRDKAFNALVDQALKQWQQRQMTDNDLLGFARWMTSDENPRPMPGAADRLLKPLSAGNDRAQLARAKLLIAYPALAGDDSAVKLLMKARAQGNAKASLLLARLYLDGQVVNQDPRKALKFAKEVQAQFPKAQYLIGRIYMKGYLGEPDVTKATHYLLAAARGGVSYADMSLAQMFWSGRGMVVNRRYAWSFALLAKQEGVMKADALLTQMTPDMSSQEQAAGAALCQREIAYRKAHSLQEASGSHPVQPHGG